MPSGVSPQHENIRHSVLVAASQGSPSTYLKNPHVMGTLDRVLYLSNIRAACRHTFELCSAFEACLARPWATLPDLLRCWRAAFVTPGSRQHMLLSAGSDRNQELHTSAAGHSPHHVPRHL